MRVDIGLLLLRPDRGDLAGHPKRKDGTTEWIPPPHLDYGQPRTNTFHHPENLLADGGDEDDEDGAA